MHYVNGHKKGSGSSTLKSQLITSDIFIIQKTIIKAKSTYKSIPAQFFLQNINFFCKLLTECVKRHLLNC